MNYELRRNATHRRLLQIILAVLSFTKRCLCDWDINDRNRAGPEARFLNVNVFSFLA